MIDSLNLRWRKRAGSNDRREVNFLDFVVNGESLLDKVGGDFVSCLGWLPPEPNERAVGRLCLDSDADFPANRRSIYICPECGDLGCGAISAVIEVDGNHVVWRDVGYQNNYDPSVDTYDEIGPFAFDAVEYVRTMQKAIRRK